MNILAIDTTGAVASVAVSDQEGRITELTSGEQMNHLQALFPMIQQALEQAGIRKNELKTIAVASGPGSFTGIRIGMAAAKTLAQALGLGMVPVQTLESFVYAERTSAAALGSRQEPVLVCPMLDARRNQVYAGAWLLSQDGSFEAVIAPDAFDVKEFLALAQRKGQEAGAGHLKFYGDGADAYSGELALICGRGAEVASAAQRYQRASYVLLGARAALKAGKTWDFTQVKPEYLRKSEAERKLAAGQLGRKKELRKKRPLPEEAAAAADPQEPVSYRAACPQDISAFAALDRRCFDHFWSEASFAGELDGTKKTYYAAAENSRGELIGFAGAAFILDEGEVNRVAVDPRYRGRGIADRLMDMVIQCADSSGIRELMLEVREANRTAIALYKNHGFVVEGKREGYYAATGENALLMRRSKKNE